MANLPPLTFRQLLEAAKTTGELREGDADYVRDLFLASYDFVTLTELQEQNAKLREALAHIASGISYDMLGTTSMSREDMQAAAKEAI